MKRGFIILLFFCLSIVFYQGNAEAVWGIPDNVHSATLVVPLMEKGISSVHDTLTVVDSICVGDKTIHWQVWDINGNATSLKGNVTFSGSWVSSFSAILGGSPPAELVDGSFYRGFMTIDIVTASTSLLPTDGAYPFSSQNCLTGWTYYVRLLEGAANGIPMIHIEAGLGGSVNDNLKGFYGFDDGREEIDNNSRYGARLLSHEQPPLPVTGVDPNQKTDYVLSRVYNQGNGESRIVLWAWAPAGHGTTAKPSDFPAGGAFQYWHFNEAGVQIANTTVALNHIVNVINVPGDTNGQVWITNIPDNFNVYAFSFNAANFSGNPDITWEAMFESTIIEQFP
jgi:hypothetical protein